MTARRRRAPLAAAARALLGAALAPTAAAACLAAAAELGGLSAGTGPAAACFLGGFAAYLAAHLLGLRLRRLYVFAHELTHALAAWASGGKVHRFVVRGESGHVDLSHTGPFVALAPYWIPLYALGVAASYRVALWLGAPRGARELFLAAMGAALAFHLAHTVQSLWQTHQSDLDEAGFALSLSLICLLNGVLLVFALKCLFPARVSVARAGGRVWKVTAAFWTEARALPEALR